MTEAITTQEFKGYINEYRGKFGPSTRLDIVIKKEPVGGKFVLWAVPVTDYTDLGGRKCSSPHWDSAMGLAAVTTSALRLQSVVAAFHDLKTAYAAVAKDWQ